MVMGGCSKTNAVELNISAGAGLIDVLTEINRLYTQVSNNVNITANFASSGTLQQQIEQGAPIDVFISAAAAQMDNLQHKGLIIDDTRQDLLTNKIVLIVPVDSDLGITGFFDLATAEVERIAIGDPQSVPAGKYAQDVFDELDITAQLESKLVFGSDVRQVLTYVETGNVDAGVVYITDALTSDKVIVVASAPADINARVVYPVAVIKTSRQVDAANAYIDFLFSDEAMTIFEKYGFTVFSD
jgi:molybdate transport system substrate-binding protein